MVRLLHEAGLEVILDVVYNHTSEEGIGGPRSSLRASTTPTTTARTSPASTWTPPGAATR